MSSDHYKNHENKYSIGEFAELCNLSRKTLRYYDELGILQPHLRNEETKYRYYSHGQISEALFLKQLKSLNFSLHDIGSLIGSNRQLDVVQLELKKRLVALRKEMETLQQQFDQTMDFLMRVIESQSRILTSCNKQQPLFCVETYPETRIIYSRYVSYWHADRLFSERRAELVKIAEHADLQVAGPMTAIFHGDCLAQFSQFAEDLNGDLEVFFSVPAQARANEHCRLIGPFQAVSGIYVGRYIDMQKFYINMMNWATYQGLELAPCSLEEYVVSSTMVGSPDYYMTKVYLPLKGSAL